MALEKELDRKAVSISKAKLDATEFVLKLLLLRCGPILSYKTKKGEGLRQQLVFIDEEGTKIQTTLFNEFTEKWKTLLVASNSYYVINGRIRRPQTLFNTLNKYKELSITQYSEIRDCSTPFETREYSNGFSSFDFIEHMNSNIHYDVFGILIDTSGLIVTAGSKRKIVTISDQWHNRVNITLWGDHAEHDGLCIDDAEACKTVIAFTNVKKTEFNGIPGFGSTPFTSIILNPTFEKSQELLKWSHNLIEDNINIPLTPSGQIRRATKKELRHMLERRHDNPQNVFCKFNATIKEVLKKESLCYAACNKCNKKVDVQGSNIYCQHCLANQDGFTYRYFVRLVLLCDKIIPTDKEVGIHSENEATIPDSPKPTEDTDGKQIGKSAITEEIEEDLEYEVTVKLFDSAKFFVGCSATEYMDSIAIKPEQSDYYQKILKAEGQRYTFMVKNYHNVPQSDRFKEFVIEEMHLVGHAGFPDIEQTAEPSNPIGKRAIGNDVEELHHLKQSRKKSKGRNN